MLRGRKRRVKCDETRPVCGRCVAARRCCEWPAFLAVWPAPVSLAVDYTHVRDLILLIPRTIPGLVAGEGFGSHGPSSRLTSSDGLNMTLAISQRMVSYMFELPARVGRSEVLDTAVASVATALRWRHTSQTQTQAFDPDTLSLYGRALRMLQRALEDDQMSTAPEVLCATELLCIFEVTRTLIPTFNEPLPTIMLQTLSGSASQAYIQHAAGVAKLIQHRGVNRFSTTFEKSLLASRAPALVSA